MATRLATHALFSFEDELALGGARAPWQAMARLRELGVREVVLKLGAAGCLVAHGDNPGVELPARPAEVVDTTAAGDSFNAGYLAYRLAGRCPLDAAIFASTLAAAVVGHRGAIIPKAAMPPGEWLTSGV